MKVLCLLLLVIYSVSATVSFDGHSVLRLNVSSVEHLEWVTELMKQNDALDFWTSPQLGSVDIRVSPEQRHLFLGSKVPSTVMIHDVGALIASQKLDQDNVTADFFTAYHDYDELFQWTKELAETYPNLLTFFSIGKTLQGRDIFGVVLTSQKGPSQKPGILMNAAVHAREWITAATLTYILNELVTNYGTNQPITNLVDAIEWIFIPILNPDGYSYSWTNDRMWRKNRRPLGSCYGVDNNRNWAFKWASGSTPCSETYPGDAPASELENQAIQKYLLSKKNIQAYIDFHAYGQLWMWSWAYTCTLVPDNAKIQAAAVKITNALTAVHGTKYTIGSICNVIYEAAGSSADFAYATAQVKYAFGVELRDTGRYGFLLPANQIIPSGQETAAAVFEMGNYILTNPI